jgi:hypothetical protein
MGRKAKGMFAVLLFVAAVFGGFAVSAGDAEAVLCAKCINNGCWLLPEDGGTDCHHPPGYPPYYCDYTTGFCVARSPEQIQAAAEFAAPDSLVRE